MQSLLSPLSPVRYPAAAVADRWSAKKNEEKRKTVEAQFVKKKSRKSVLSNAYIPQAILCCFDVMML